MLSLRGVTPQLFAEFKHKLATTMSQKDQRALIKKLLVHAGGKELKALAETMNLNCKVSIKSSTATPEALAARAAPSGASDFDEIPPPLFP